MKRDDIERIALEVHLDRRYVNKPLVDELSECARRAAVEALVWAQNTRESYPDSGYQMLEDAIAALKEKP